MKNKSLLISFGILNFIELAFLTVLFYIYIPTVNIIISDILGYGIFPWYERDPIGLLLVLICSPFLLAIAFTLKHIEKKLSLSKFNSSVLIATTVILLLSLFVIGSFLSNFAIISGWILILITFMAILINTIKVIINNYRNYI